MAQASPEIQAVAESDLHQKAASADVYNSPGWRRLQERQATRGMGQPRESRNVTIDAKAVSAFEVGERVFHQKFGYGVIEIVEGDKVDVAFEKSGTKKVVSKFLVGSDKAGDVPF